MANPRLPILGSFEDIGEEVAQNITKLPGDILGKALESVGVSSGSGSTKQPAKPNATQQDGSNWQQIDKTQNQEVKKTIARNALEELLKNVPQTELTEYEKKKKEEEEKAKAQKEQQKQQDLASLPKMTAKRARGDLHGMKAKKGGGGNELSKNVKAE
jgi:hypothetical protein